MKNNRLCMLMILDGWGIGEAGDGNAILQARMPNLDRILADYPRTQLHCFGKSVGLPDGIMGNSEVGHLNIGAGRIVYQDILRIDVAIEDGSFFENAAFKALFSKMKGAGGRLHLIGLLSDGGVHSHIGHLFALIDLAVRESISGISVHPILDGRDTAPDSGSGFIARLSEKLKESQVGGIATICGRYFAMDRDNRWDRVEKAYRLLTRGEGRVETDPVQAVRNAYGRGETDEFVQPIVISEAGGAPDTRIREGDAVIFFNFRADRAREITRALTDPEFSGFTRDPFPELSAFVGMTRYDERFNLPMAFSPVRLEEILGEVVGNRGLRQLRIAETEKYAHVTYFFNGGEETPFPLEDRCLIPSPREVPTYDKKPEMSAHEVTREVLGRIRSGIYDFIVLNFANMDMVGHTGVIEAAVRACEALDGDVGEIAAEVRRRGGALLITADHGNAEKMRDGNGNVHTAHTLNPVPFVLVDDTRKDAVLHPGILADIAPTILEILGVSKPEKMTGRSLLAP